ncbi:type I phosphomannose isomerase catalytic subunit, partial [Escherichia coli]|uniref:type I phosphomannose isomerase catalytic subunit n=1 Tax=Escherichia coli TaxID=562 RepID=UPI003296FB89
TELFGMENPSSQPMAELWMGAHPKSSSRVQNAAGDIVSLRDVIESDKSTLLGEAVAKRFGERPFLFQVLCAAQAPSLQVHPNKHKHENRLPKTNTADNT